MTRAEAAAFLRDLREPAPRNPQGNPACNPGRGNTSPKTRPEHIRVSVLFEPRPRS